MRRANGSRGEHAPLRIEPAAGKTPEGPIEAEGAVPADVFENNSSWFELGNDPLELRPEVGSLVREAASLPGLGVGLARVSTVDEIHATTPRSAVEREHVREDRSWIQGLLFHPGHEAGCGEGFLLDVAHGPEVGPHCSKTKVEPADAGTQREGT